jgi:hypothetical protein
MEPGRGTAIRADNTIQQLFGFISMDGFRTWAAAVWTRFKMYFFHLLNYTLNA